MVGGRPGAARARAPSKGEGLRALCCAILRYAALCCVVFLLCCGVLCCTVLSYATCTRARSYNNVHLKRGKVLCAFVLLSGAPSTLRGADMEQV